MNKKDTIRILQILGLSILFSALTIAIVYFVTTRRAPTAPVSQPKAAPGCYAEFFFPSPTPTVTVTPTATPTLTGTPTSTPTITPTPTATPTPVPGCGETCTSGESTCQTGLVCAVPEGTTSGFCALPEFQTACLGATAETAPNICCTAPTSTVTPTPIATNTPTPTSTPTPTNTPTPTPNPSVTPTNTPTNTPTATNTPIPIVGCQDTCSSNANCSSGLTCMNVSGVNRCVNSSCPYASNCVCTAPTNTPTNTPTPVQYIAKAQPLATPTEIVLPQAGVTSTTWTAIAGGGFLVLLGIIFFAL